jgi:hypothetical protein
MNHLNLPVSVPFLALVKTSPLAISIVPSRREIFGGPSRTIAREKTHTSLGLTDDIGQLKQIGELGHAHSAADFELPGISLLVSRFRGHRLCKDVMIDYNLRKKLRPVRNVFMG